MKLSGKTLTALAMTAILLSACSAAPENNADEASQTETVTETYAESTAAETAVSETGISEADTTEITDTEAVSPTDIDAKVIDEFTIPAAEGDYISLYKDILTEKLAEYGEPDDDFLSDHCFELFDLDNDAVPELVLSLGGFHAAGAELFTISDGNVISLGTYGSYGEVIIREYDDTYILDSCYSGMGVTSGVYYVKKGTEMEPLISYSDEFYAADMFAANNPDEEPVPPYYINDEPVTKDEFNSRLSEYKTDRIYSVGKLMLLNSETVNSGIFDNVIQKAERYLSENTGGNVIGVLRGKNTSAVTIDMKDSTAAVYFVNKDGSGKYIGRTDGSHYIDMSDVCCISQSSSTDVCSPSTMMHINNESGSPVIDAWEGDTDIPVNEIIYCCGDRVGEYIRDSFSNAFAFIPYNYYDRYEERYIRYDLSMISVSELEELDTYGIAADKDRIVSIIKRSNGIINVNYSFDPDGRTADDIVSRTFIDTYDGLIAYDINDTEQAAMYGRYPENMQYPDENGAMG